MRLEHDEGDLAFAREARAEAVLPAPGFRRKRYRISSATHLEVNEAGCGTIWTRDPDRNFQHDLAEGHLGVRIDLDAWSPSLQDPGFWCASFHVVSADLRDWRDRIFPQV